MQQVETRETDGSEPARTTYEEFADWVTANDFSLALAFEVRPRYGPGTTETWMTVIFPIVAQAIHADDELRAILPSSDEFGPYRS